MAEMRSDSGYAMVKAVVCGECSEPTPGQYYALEDGRMLLCINVIVSMGLSFYWFIDAENAPITVLASEDLRDHPVRWVELAPVSETGISGGI